MTFSAPNQSSLSLSSIHKANLLTQLSRRLEVAKAHQNQSLIADLEYEYTQLTATTQSVSLGSRLQQLWMGFAETLSEWNKVHIEETVDASGQRCWYAYNPQASQAMVTGSKDEMQQWVNKTYWGR